MLVQRFHSLILIVIHSIDYYRLGHGSDQHVRKPTPIQCMRGKKVIHVAVGALHCLAVTDTGQVYGWGDNGEFSSISITANI